MTDFKTIEVSIDRDHQSVYDFVSNLENLPQWASAFCRSIKRANANHWIAETPQGLVRITIVAKNTFGILDHYVNPSLGVEVYVPMRVVPNGSKSLVLFTLLRRPEMTEEQFAQDQKWVEQDLKTLKQVLEQQLSGKAKS